MKTGRHTALPNCIGMCRRNILDKQAKAIYFLIVSTQDLAMWNKRVTENEGSRLEKWLSDIIKDPATGLLAAHWWVLFTIMRNLPYDDDPSSDCFLKSQGASSLMTWDISISVMTNIIPWICASHCLGLNLCSTIYLLCDLGQVTPPLGLHIGKMEMKTKPPSWNL